MKKIKNSIRVWENSKYTGEWKCPICGSMNRIDLDEKPEGDKIKVYCGGHPKDEFNLKIRYVNGEFCY